MLARVLGSLETSRLAAAAAGLDRRARAGCPAGTRGALLALGAVLPLFVVLRWAPLRAFEMVACSRASLRALRANPIFTPLPVVTLERLSHDVVELRVDAGEQIITQGHHGDRFYLIDDGEVEIFEIGSSVTGLASPGEIALLRDVPRTATVRANSRLAGARPLTPSAVTGQVRSRTVADDHRLSARRRAGSGTRGEEQ